MDFVKDPKNYWNRASPQVKKVIQKFLFPNGIPYDFKTGYGTAETIQSYLLIQKMTDKSAANTNMVAPTGFEPVTLGL